MAGTLTVSGCDRAHVVRRGAHTRAAACFPGVSRTKTAVSPPSTACRGYGTPYLRQIGLFSLDPFAYSRVQLAVGLELGEEGQPHPHARNLAEVQILGELVGDPN